MAEDKNKQVEAELRSTFGRLLPEGRKNEELLQEEQLNVVTGGNQAIPPEWFMKDE